MVMKEERQENKSGQSPDISKMSRLLLTGSTMLADVCPDCNVPLFRKDKIIFCPNCNRKAVYVSSNDEVKEVEHMHLFSESIEQLQDILTGKLNYLSQKLASAESYEEMKDILQLVELIVDIEKKILGP